MDKIIDIFFNLLKDDISKHNNYFTLIIISFFFLLVMLIYYIKYQDEFKRVMCFLVPKKGRSKVKIELSDSKTDNAIRDMLETIKFKKYSGINIEKARRELLIDFHEQNSFNLTWSEIKAARSFIDFSNGKINVKLSKYSNGFLILIVTSMIMVFFFGLFVLLFILNYMKQLSLKEILGFSIFVFYFWMTSIMLFNNFYNLSSAKKISKITNKI